MKKVRQAAQKKEVKKKRFLLFASIEQFIGFCFFIIVFTISSWVIVVVKRWVDDPERVVLSQVTLTGDDNFTKEVDIRKAIMDLGLPNTYIAQDVDDIQREIMRLPWVKQVSVRKQWPDRLIVHIVEYQPSYYWNEVFLLDQDGVVFSVPKERIQNQDMPKLSGPIGKEKLILKLYKELETISKESSSKDFTLFINQASADERNAWQLFVKPCVGGFCANEQEIKLMLGREKMIDRYKRFVRFFADIQSSSSFDERLIEVDLRYENGISVKKQKID